MATDRRFVVATGTPVQTATWTGPHPFYPSIYVTGYPFGTGIRSALQWGTRGTSNGLPLVRVTEYRWGFSGGVPWPGTFSSFVGQEVSRTFEPPEPVTGTLLLLGVSGLAGLEATRRLRTWSRRKR